tara:strand:- start:9322 stop:9423 length:102 start_codon:yes stop_codon:yes gene_type:complete
MEICDSIGTLNLNEGIIKEELKIIYYLYNIEII